MKQAVRLPGREASRRPSQDGHGTQIRREEPRPPSQPPPVPASSGPSSSRPLNGPVKSEREAPPPGLQREARPVQSSGSVPVRLGVSKAELVPKVKVGETGMKVSPKVLDSNLKLAPKMGDQSMKMQQPKVGEQNMKMQQPKVGEQNMKMQQPKVGEQNMKMQQPKVGEQNMKMQQPKVGEQNMKMQQPKFGEASAKMQQPKSGEQSARVQQPKLGEQSARVQQPKSGEQSAKVQPPKVGEQSARVQPPKVGEQSAKVPPKVMRVTPSTSSHAAESIKPEAILKKVAPNVMTSRHPDMPEGPRKALRPAEPNPNDRFRGKCVGQVLGTGVWQGVRGGSGDAGGRGGQTYCAFVCPRPLQCACGARRESFRQQTRQTIHCHCIDYFLQTPPLYIVQ